MSGRSKPAGLRPSGLVLRVLGNFTKAFGQRYIHGLERGRRGGALVHDHPGRQVSPDTFGAVGPWPCRGCAEGEVIYRYDLGLFEFVALLVLGALLYGWFARTIRPHGRITGFVAALYGPIRFTLDFFRETEAGKGVSIPDVRYFGLTTAQYFSIAFFLASK